MLLKALGVSKKELLDNKVLLNSVLLYHVIGKVGYPCVGAALCCLT